MSTVDPGVAAEAIGSMFAAASVTFGNTVPGSNRMKLYGFRLGDVSIGYLRCTGGVRIAVQAVDSVIVTLPRRGVWDVEVDGTWHSRAEPGQAVVFSADCVGTALGEADHWCHVVKIPHRRLRAELESLLGRPALRTVEFEPGMDVDDGAGLLWSGAVELAEHQSRLSNGLLENSRVTSDLETLLIHGLLFAQPHSYLDELGSAVAPEVPQVVRDAMRLMETHPERAWSVEEISRAVATSSRNLQRSFREAAGVTPMHYLKDVRLLRARTDLQFATPGRESVSQVAARWGFRDLSRFSAAYRHKYGELPSRTLNR